MVISLIQTSNEKKSIKMLTHRIRVINRWLLSEVLNPNPYERRSFERPLVSIVFDDGSKDQLKAYYLLRNYGMTGTFYISPGAIDTPGYMTSQHIQKLIRSGMHLGSHTMNHIDLQKIPVRKVCEELEMSKYALAELGVAELEDFASPYGSVNKKAIKEIRRVYSSHRGIVLGYNTKENFDQYNIRIFEVLSFTSIQEIKKRIEKAKQSNYWLVLMLHKIDKKNDVYSITSTMLDDILEICSDNVPVVTVAEAIKELMPQLTR